MRKSQILLVLCAVALTTQSTAYQLPLRYLQGRRCAGVEKCVVSAFSQAKRRTALHVAGEGKVSDMSKADVLAEELKIDLAKMFDLTYEPKWSLYADDVVFTDPLNKFTGIQKYKDNINMLKDSPLFSGGKMDLHEIKVVDSTRVDTRWTLTMTFKAFPWKPRLLFTGTTEYIINQDTGLVVKHLDKWDSVSNNTPVSFEAILELASQLAPDVAGLGARALKGAALDAAPYTVLRRYADASEVRRYRKHTRVATPRGEVYNKESYDYAASLLLSYRGDALAAAENAAGRILPRTEPSLQMDSGQSDSYLAYLLPPGMQAPKPLSSCKDLEIQEVPQKLVAVLPTRGFGSDRGRSEEVLAEKRAYLRALMQKEGFEVMEKEGAFTLANYADGYEIWLNVEPQQQQQ